MYTKKRIVCWILLAFFSLKGASQSALVCNDLVTVQLDSGCSKTINPFEVLEGGPYGPESQYIVQIDKVLPLGNGPWIPAYVNYSEYGNTYQVRVQDSQTGNICWGNIKVGTHLICSGVTEVNLNNLGVAVVTPAQLSTSVYDVCADQALNSVVQINFQPSHTLNCQKTGINEVILTVQLTPTLQQNCFGLLNVKDPLGICNNCVKCPTSATVTYQEGVSTLIPAYQSANHAAFDVYGAPVQKGVCNIGPDSSYSINLTQLSQQGWNAFERKWLYKDNNGTLKDSCVQDIVILPFPTTVSGKIFVDTVANCAYDTDEHLLQNIKIVATALPSGKTYITTSGSDGSYNLPIQLLGTETSVIVQTQFPNNFVNLCPNSLSIPLTAPQSAYQMDFPIRGDVLCRHLNVNLETPMWRRCFLNTFYISYCNNGLLPVNDVKIKVSFDTLVQISGASIPWAAVDSNTYTFNLGQVGPLTCGNFNLQGLLSCNAQLGQTICAEATIYPLEDCGEGPWEGPLVKTVAVCDLDSVRLSIKNVGQQDMNDALDFIVIEDIIMYRNGQFQLNSGDSIQFTMPANGATWRIEAEQVPGYQISDPVFAVSEGCGGTIQSGLVAAFSMNDDDPQHDIDCDVVVGSFDPNDKAATPTGYGAAHITGANTAIEYKIRFQNTGTDTAFKVVIVDSLSSLLDFAQLEPGTSSHPYRLNVYPGGVLHFVFDPIALPDSNVNLAGSQGFVNFRIKQKPDLPHGSVIENKAAIYFDFNEAVVTNTVFHTIGEPFVAVNTQQAVQPGIHLKIMPNPFSDHCTLLLEGASLGEATFEMYDMQGKLLQSSTFRGNTHKLYRQGLASGLYFYRIKTGNHLLNTGKLSVH